MNYQSFVFESYDFDAVTKTLKLQYSFDSQLNFTETYRFDFEFIDYDAAQLDRAVQNLFFMAGVSYFKAYPCQSLTIEFGQLSQADARFFSETYQKGLGEYFYVNNLDPGTEISFPVITEAQPVQKAAVEDGLLIGLGGGKDSLVSVELLRSQPRVATWSLGHAEQLAPLVETIGLPHFAVERTIDQTLLEHNAAGARNGHVPISAILACTATIVSILTGYGNAVVSNENSANEPTLQYRGHDINHQYSKSLHFEQAYQALLARQFGGALQYFSLLRPLSELAIAERFSKFGFDRYKDVFSSCNRAFRHGKHELFWCGECPKCAFVYLALAPFTPETELIKLWNGKNLLLDDNLEPLYRQILGIQGDKPLDCVGEVQESRTAMRLMQQWYPEMSKYSFDVPSTYDFRQLADHSMLEYYYALLLDSLPGSSNNVIK